jgi:hypothetical protein
MPEVVTARKKNNNNNNKTAEDWGVSMELKPCYKRSSIIVGLHAD